MKCQKCANAAVFHLTDFIKDKSGQKRMVELHLCAQHASELGKPVTPPPAPAAAPPAAPTAAIVPVKPPAGGGMVVVKRPGTPHPDALVCPTCGMTWAQFKQTGRVGCAHDYALFEGRLVPLLRRAQEGGDQHVGKIPHRLLPTEPAKHLTELRLRRELRQALDAENYEQAARVRDQLKQLESEA